MAYKLSDARDLKRRLFHGFCDHVKARPAHLLKRALNYAGARYAHVYDDLGLAHAVKCARHKGIILDGVGKYD